MKKRYEIRNMDSKTIEKLNKLRKLMNLKQNEVIKKIIDEYFERNKDKLIKQFLK